MKTLTKRGNSLALVIEKPILELLGADADTPYDVTTDGPALILTPVRDVGRRKRFLSALESTNKKYSKTLKKLAK